MEELTIFLCLHLWTPKTPRNRCRRRRFGIEFEWNALIEI